MSTSFIIRKIKESFPNDQHHCRFCRLAYEKLFWDPNTITFMKRGRTVEYCDESRVWVLKLAIKIRRRYLLGKKEMMFRKKKIV